MSSVSRVGMAEGLSFDRSATVSDFMSSNRVRLVILVFTVAASACTGASFDRPATVPDSDPVSELARSEPSESTPTTLGEPPSTLESGCIELEPHSDFQALVDTAGPGAEFCLTAGVFSGFTVRPHDDQRFEGVPGTVLDGADATAHAFWSDEERAADRVRIAGVEIARYRSDRLCEDFTSDCSGAVVRGGAIEPYVQVLELIPLVVEPDLSSLDWEVTEVVVHGNAGTGVSLGEGMTLTNSIIRDNSHLGVGGGVVSSVSIVDNTFSGNSYDDRLPPNWEVGQIKLGFVSNIELVGNNFHDGVGPAFWCDIQCTDVIVSDNVITATNQLRAVGIYIEASEGIEVSQNRISTITGDCGPTDGIGIDIAESRSVMVAKNVIVDADIAIQVRQRDRSGYTGDLEYWARTVTPDTDSLWRTREVTVSGNSVSGSGACRPDQSGRVGLLVDDSEHPNLVGVTDEVTFTDNDYGSPVGERDFVWGQEYLSWTDWVALGNS